jgi:VanZ family protein
MLPLRLARAWLLVGWGGVLAAFAVSLWPGGVPLPVDVWDKVQHGLGYFVLTLWFTGLYPREKYLRIAAACFLLGLAIEGLQGLSATRTMEFADVLANTTGIAAALALAYVLVGGWAMHLERFAGLAPERG